MFLNIRLAAPDAGTNFTILLPAALYWFHTSSNCLRSSALGAMMPRPIPAAASSFRKGNPVLNSFNWFSICSWVIPFWAICFRSCCDNILKWFRIVLCNLFCKNTNFFLKMRYFSNKIVSLHENNYIWPICLLLLTRKKSVWRLKRLPYSKRRLGWRAMLFKPFIWFLKLKMAGWPWNRSKSSMTIRWCAYCMA